MKTLVAGTQGRDLAVLSYYAAHCFTSCPIHSIRLPISAFAMMGFEHCIANMYVLPMAIAMGAPITPAQVLW